MLKGPEAMCKSLMGQILLILCCVFYLIWWYRGYRPGTEVNRVGGTNGIYFLITVAFGLAGLVVSLMPVPEIREPMISPLFIVIVGVVSYLVFLLITRFAFQRIVTTELFLIIGWTMLEMTVINRMYAARILSGKGFTVMCIVIAVAFLISMILYVAYYKMEEMKAFYAAMVPLITEAAAMALLIAIVLAERK